MHFHLIMCIMLAVCLCAVPVLAASASSSNKSFGQAKVVDEDQKILLKNAVSDEAGNFTVKLGKDFNAPEKGKGILQTQSFKKENVAQKARDGERARKPKLDDPEKAPLKV